jgi:hypothetical protein
VGFGAIPLFAGKFWPFLAERPKYAHRSTTAVADGGMIASVWQAASMLLNSPFLMSVLSLSGRVLLHQ